MQLTIIVPSFNTKDLTKQCLQSLVTISNLKLNKDFEIVVVDNGSLDGSAKMIKKEFPKVKLIKSPENLGFSRGNNLGIKHSDTTTKYLLFLNSDTTVPTGTLSEMLRLMEQDKKIGISTCKVMLWTGGIDMDCHRGFPTPWASLTRLTRLNKVFFQSKFFNQYNQGWKDLNTTHEIDSAVGAFMLVRRNVGNQIGWWDEDYFLNGEDIDFCYCVKELGYKVMYHPLVNITHYRGASKGTRKESKEVTRATKKTKNTVAKASVEAMGIFYNKHLRKQYPCVVNKIVDTGICLLRLKRQHKKPFRAAF